MAPAGNRPDVPVSPVPPVLSTPEPHMQATASLQEIRIHVARSERQYARILDLRARAGEVVGVTHGSTHDGRRDHQRNAVLLLAESVQDGEALGTLRILAGDRGPLAIDGRTGLPPALHHRSVAEASCLAVRPGSDAGHVRRMLWKAWYRYSRIARLRVMLACVPQDLVPACEGLGMTDITPASIGTQPYRSDAMGRRLMQLDVAGLRDWMQRQRHPLCGFMLDEPHSEIDLIGLPDQAVLPSQRGGDARGRPLPAAVPVAGLAVV